MIEIKAPCLDVYPFGSNLPMPGQEGPVLFLAGPIAHPPDDWRTRFTEALKNVPGTILNPVAEPSPDSGPESIAWSVRAMSRSDAFAFWFPPFEGGDLSLLELGSVSGLATRQLYVGLSPSYGRRADVIRWLFNTRPATLARSSIEETLRDIVPWAERRAARICFDNEQLIRSKTSDIGTMLHRIGILGGVDAVEATLQKLHVVYGKKGSS